MALQGLYQVDLRGEEVADDVRRWLAEATAEPEVRVFARQLVDGGLACRDALDARIASVAQNWEIRRMAVVDRNILRLASYELLYLDDVPVKVSINEAIDLAKRYSTADSGAFVNGILDRIRLDGESVASDAAE